MKVPLLLVAATGPFNQRPGCIQNRVSGRRWWPRRPATCSSGADRRATMALMIGRPEIDPALVRAAQRGDRIAVADVMDALAPYVGRVCGPVALQAPPDPPPAPLPLLLQNPRALPVP